MKTGTRPHAGAASFAHLVAPTRAAASRAEDETDDEREEREDREREANKKATGHAETDDEREKREDEDGDEEARAEEKDGDEEGDDDNDKEEMRGRGTISRARARERSRIRAILSAPAAARNLAVACDLACNTTLSRDEALRVLGKTAPASRADRAERNPRIGSGASTHPQQQGQAQGMWTEAFGRAVPALRQRRQ